MTTSISPLFSSHCSISLDDWITGLGEKAFIAWLRFHSWKDGQASSSQEPFLLPLSLNKIIQRLKIGKATFYHKVLQPLLDYGLIGLQPAPDTPRELHLLVYALPEQASDHQVESSPSPNDIHPHVDSAAPSSTDPQPGDLFSAEWTPDPIANRNGSEIHDLPDLPSTPPRSKGTIHPNPGKKTRQDLSPSLDSLPNELQQTIMEDPRLVERMNGIIQTYHECREHPSFIDSDFQQKMLSCITYPHDPHRFGAYLRKALLNEWNKPSSRPAKKSSPPSPLPCSKDVPEWVFQQQERQRMNLPHRNEGLNPDQQAEANRLLKALGEI